MDEFGTDPPPAQVERMRRLYRRVAPLYDSFRSIWSRITRPAEAALDRLFRERIGSTTRVLELGPGTGVNIERLFRCGATFSSYLGIDSSEEMLLRARQRSRDDPRIELRLGDATELERIGGSFDFIVSSWLLSHLERPHELVRDAFKLLSPEGTAVFVFLTAPEGAVLRHLVERLGGPFGYRSVDTTAIRALPNLEEALVCASGIATVAVFRAPRVVV
jgi:ubiquinone/menaquinone biosynthesis C-methylase UbiE